MSKKGLLISFEGCEGSGKTTQADILSDRLSSMGYKIVRTREPGGTKTGEMIRGILQHDSSGEDIELATEALLFAASRAQMVKQVVDPALEAGELVISDRYVDSAVAYQGYGREMGPELIKSVNALAIDGTLPDVTFLLDIEVHAGMQRMRDRSIASGAEIDRIEREEMSFHQRVKEGYLEIAQASPDRFVIIDGSLPQEEIEKVIWGKVEPRLPGTG
jgi:dTMP kinase